MVLRPTRSSSASASASASADALSDLDREADDRDRDEEVSPRSRTMSSEPAEGIPAFLAKLWKLVDESRTDTLISWGPGGNTFVIKNQIDFARKLLPLYYKHNNMASFVRQLNMYGFHKVVSVENGSLKCENEEIQFSHPCFVRGHPYMLQHIKRKIATSRTATAGVGDEKAPYRPELVSKVLSDVKEMKGRQETLDVSFAVMKRENEALWREVALLRQKHIKQQQIVNNLIQFLMSLVKPLKTGKRRYQLMINDAAHNDGYDDVSNKRAKFSKHELENDIDEDDNEFVLPDMIEVDGPTIREVGDHDQSAGDPGLVNDSSSYYREGRSRKTPSRSSASSSIIERYEADNEDAPVMDDNNAEELILDISEVGDNLRFPGLNPDVVVQKDRTDKGKCEKNSGKKSKRMSYSPLMTNVAEASPTLPSNIFDSDETNSQDENVLLTADTNVSLSDLLPEAEDARPAAPDDELANTINSGCYNLNIDLNSLMSNSKGKSKGSKQKTKETIPLNIKEEVVNEDSSNYNDMTVATIPGENVRPTLGRFNSIEDVDDHLISMQNDIDNLRELLSTDTLSLDANTLLGLFDHDEPLYGLSMNPSDMTATDKDDGQLVSYVPPMPNLGFEDFMADNDAENEQPCIEMPSSSAGEDTTLNTPQIQIPELNFPNDSID